MNNSNTHKLARRFIELPLEKRKIFLEGLKKENVDFGLFPIVANVDVPDRYALSYAQQRMWFLWQLDPDSAAYNLPSAICLNGPLDQAAFAKAFNDLLARHETLRMCVQHKEGETPVQSIQPASPAIICHKDLTALPEAERDSRAKEIAIEESLLPFNLMAGPLFRVRLLKVDSEQHILLLTMHHIIADGWSMNVMIEEFIQFYSAHCAKQAPAISALPIQYTDYALWQRSWLEAGEASRQLAYWQSQLGEQHPVLALPTDYARPAMPSYSGARQEFPLDDQLSLQLRSLAQDYNTTLFMLLLAAYKILLFRYTGQRDLRVGSPVANRNRSEIEGLIGCFINTQVLRSEVDGQITVEELIAQVRTVTLESQDNQDLPFEKLVDALKLERNLSHNPLFQVMYNHQANVADIETLETGCGLSLQPLAWENQVAQVDLKLDTWEKGGKLFASLTWACDLFLPETIERIGQHWLAILQQIVANPQQRIGDIEILAEDEKQKILTSWNKTEAEYPRSQCFYQLFEAQVEKTPDAIALIGSAAEEGQSLSYAELNARANRLAHRLREQGVGPEVLVGVATERCIDMVVGLLAIMKAGGAYVPLDPNFPKARLAYMLENSGLKLLLSQSHLQQALPLSDIAGEQPQVICLDKIFNQQYSDQNLSCVGDASNLAYVIYTSGSTGKPKGVSIPHQRLVNFLSSMAKQPGIDSDDRVIALTSLSFDIAGLELYLPLINGAGLIILDTVTSKDPEKLLAATKLHSATFIQATPSTWKMLLSVDDPSYLANCKVLAGGEVLSAAQAAEMLDLVDQVWNVYGPTETTIWSAVYCLDKEYKIPYLGAPINNTTIHILNNELQPQPPGVAGELFIGGEGLARCYLHRPDLTAERFIPSPYDSDGGACLYRTGDLARYREDGCIEYLGRLDFQVKVRGFRIELGDIESQLLAHNEVKDAAVVAWEGSSGNYLVAYLATHDDTFCKADSEIKNDFRARIKSHLQDSLPEYMVPDQIVFLPTMPLTPNGKLDRKALQYVDKSQLQKTYVAPVTEVEICLAGIWQDLLGVEKIGLDDNFFELGGDSIISIQLVGRVRQNGYLLTPKSIFQYQTLQALAAACEELDAEQPASYQDERFSDPQAMLSAEQIESLAVSLENIESVFPLSPMQEGMLLHTMLEPGSGMYFMQDGFSVDREIDLEKFTEAWNIVVSRHDALRAIFLWDDDSNISQIVLRDFDVPINYLDWTGDTQEQYKSNVETLLYKERVAGFELDKTSPFRLTLIALEPKKYYCVVSYHHILMDAWCKSLLIRDFFQIYQKLEQGESIKLQEVSPFSEYIGWLQQRDGQLSEAYWRNELQDFEKFNLLPFDRQLGTKDDSHSEVEELIEALEPQHTAKLQKFSSEYQLTINTFFQAAWALVLHRYSGQRDILYGITVAGRPLDMPQLQDTIGLFINTVPLRMRLPDAAESCSVKQWLKQLLDHNLSLREHEHEPLVNIQSYSPIDNGSSLFDSLFVYESVPFTTEVTSEADTMGAEEASFRTHTNYPLTVVIYPGETMRIGLSFDHRYFDTSTIQDLLVETKRLVIALIEGFNEDFAKLPILAQQETQTLLEGFNQTEKNYPFEQGYIALFEEQVKHCCDQPAVRCQGEVWTYKELNQRSNRVAHKLIDTAVKPDTVVAILSPRGLPMLAMINGVFKAAAAYLALSPSSPANRLATQLSANKVDVLLCEASVADLVTEVMELLPAKQRPAIVAWNSTQQAENSSQNPGLPISGQHLAYIIHTSGSTGLPKGVMVEHAGMLNNQLSKIPYLNIDSTSVIAQTASQSFDISVWQFLTAALCGAQVEIIPDEITQDPVALLNHVNEKNITILELVPSLIAAMLDDKTVPLDSLSHLLCTGEAMPPEVAKRWLQRYPHIKLINAYGPAECSDDVAMHPIQLDDTDNIYLSIGSPTDNFRLQVLAEDLSLLPIRASGELHIAGTGVGRGYWGDPARTAETFIPCEFSQVPGERIYRSGDLVQRRYPQGDLAYIGRADEQVKIRGFRIELGEIRSQLQANSALDDAAVHVREDNNSKQLVGYLVPQNADFVHADLQIQQSFLDSINAYLQTVLPPYMLPQHLLLLPQIPLTPNGKLDRKALLAIDISSPQATYIAPRNKTEQQLVSLWQELLGHEHIGVTDSFFALGGDSLRLVRLVAKVKRQFSVELSVKDLYQRDISVESIAASFLAIKDKEKDLDMALDVLDEIEQLGEF